MVGGPGRLDRRPGRGHPGRHRALAGLLLAAARADGSPSRLSSRFLVGPSARMQSWMASVVLDRSRNIGPIDPMLPTPRLTLGYVVSAHRVADR